VHNRSDFDSLVPSQTFSRRTFLKTSLGAGFALAVQPAMGQTVIQTDTNGLLAGEVKIPVSDGQMPAYRAQPAQGSAFPTILVVQEIFGVHEYIKDVCRRLAKLGYLAIAPELYARQGDPAKFTSIPELMAQIVSKVPDAQVMADLDACTAWAGKNGGDPARVGITGFCWGGRITWLYAAHNPRLRAGVAWYGRLVGQPGEFTPKHPTDIAGQLKAPVLGLYGGQDQGIPQDSVQKMRGLLEASANPPSRDSRIIVYENAPHAFHADYRPSFRKVEAEEGWKQLLAWFDKHGL